MGTLIDLRGQKYGRLQPFRNVGNRNGAALWECICDCGKAVVVFGNALRTGNTKSCGCLKRELNKTKGITHGMTLSNEHAIWTAMLQRCTNPKNKDFQYYGGRGIRVCDRWRKFVNFLSDMGVRPTLNHCIERIDNDGDYTPSNCKWATRIEQANNMRSNRVLTIDGERKTLTQWSRLSGINKDCIRYRLDCGMPTKVAIFSPSRR